MRRGIHAAPSFITPSMARLALDFLGRGVPEVARSALLTNRAWVGGRWVAATGGNTFPVVNPSNGGLIAEAPDLGMEETKEAIQSAYDAQKQWKQLTAKERSKTLKRWHDLIMEHQSDLAKIVTLEQGKPLSEAMLEVAYGASFVEWFAEEGKRVYGDVIPSPAVDKRLFTIKQPVGVAAMITPWNFPIAMITRKVAPALAVGCTAVVKPSEETPFTALALAELSRRAGFPAGVFNVVTCGRQRVQEVGTALMEDEKIAKLSFTGSTAVGKHLMAGCSTTVKRLSLELGGNAPFIVFNSADVKVAVKAMTSSKFRNTGQTCISANRLLVQSGIHNQFVEELSKSLKHLKQGDGFEKGVTQGPLINSPALEKVTRHVNDAVSKGAEVIVGGRCHPVLGGTFYQPSVLTGVHTNMVLTQEEIFGPVAPIIKFEEEEEAISIANATQHGLISYLFSRDVSQIFRVSEAMESGMVGVNEGAVSMEVTPFGGIKQSGFGREGSKYGINEYVDIKYICLGNI